MMDAMQILPAVLEDVGEEDLAQIVDICMSATSVETPGGPMRIMKGKTCMFPEIQTDLSATIMICWHCIKYNCSGFFGEIASLLTQNRQNGNQPKA